MSGQWDFYPCLVDDAPASILLDLSLTADRPEELDTVYWVGLEILEPGDHGMGSGADVDALHALEDDIGDAATAAGVRYVGRLRNRGDWQLTFYGPAGREAALDAIAARAIAGTTRGYRIGHKHDPPWSYYDDFLMPGPERMQWIQDRRLVEQLRGAGDAIDVPRPIDHFAYFPDAAGRDAFAAGARELGFATEVSDPDEPGATHMVQATRVDVAELEHVHEVVMGLVELAEAHGGDYDGWGAPIAKRGEGSSAPN